MFGSNNFEKILGNYADNKWFPGVESYGIKLTNTKEFNDNMKYIVSRVLDPNNLPPSITCIAPEFQLCLSLILEQESVKVMKYFLDIITKPGYQQRGITELNNAMKKIANPILNNLSPFEQMLGLLEFQKKHISNIKKICSPETETELFSFSSDNKQNPIKIIFTNNSKHSLMHFKLKSSDGKSYTYDELAKMNVTTLNKLNYFIQPLTALELIRQPYYLFNVIFKQALYISGNLDIKDRFSTSNEFSSVEGSNQNNFIKKIKIKEHDETGKLIYEQYKNGQTKEVRDERIGVIRVKEKLVNDPNDEMKQNEIKRNRHTSSFYTLFQGIKKPKKTKLDKENDYYMKKMGLNIQTTAYEILEALKQEYNQENRPMLNGHLFRLFCTTMTPFKNLSFYEDILAIITPSFPKKTQDNINKFKMLNSSYEINYEADIRFSLKSKIDDIMYCKAFIDIDDCKYDDGTIVPLEDVYNDLDKEIDSLKDELKKLDDTVMEFNNLKTHMMEE